MKKVRFSVMLDKKHLDFLADMVRKGEVESLGQGIRKCIAFYMTYVGKCYKTVSELFKEGYISKDDYEKLKGELLGERKEA